METIAVYWEEQVKVYGISQKKDLLLTRIHSSNDSLTTWSKQIKEYENAAGRFELISFIPQKSDSFELCIVTTCKTKELLENRLSLLKTRIPSTNVTITQPVDILYLHGPHFQDRYGIIDVAHHALAKNSLSPFLINCSGTSMYFVLQGGQGGVCKKVLADTFHVPVK